MITDRTLQLSKTGWKKLDNNIILCNNLQSTIIGMYTIDDKK